MQLSLVCHCKHCVPYVTGTTEGTGATGRGRSKTDTANLSFVAGVRKLCSNPVYFFIVLARSGLYFVVTGTLRP